METLPTIKELYSDENLILLGQENKLNVLLNQPPKQEWLKEHPMVKKCLYIPIGRLEWLMTRIFVEWYVEIRDSKLIGNSAVVVVRVHYKSVTTAEWKWMDGIGASPLQTDKDAGAIDFNKLKSGAVMMAAPAAESYAFKDAVEKLGKLFGKDLNRADQIMYDSLLGNFADESATLQLAMMEKIIKGLGKYEGKDKEKIKAECLKAQKENSFTKEFAQKVAKQIGIEL